MGEENGKGGRGDGGDAEPQLLLTERFAINMRRMPRLARAALAVGIIGLTAYLIADFDFVPFAGWIDEATLGFLGLSVAIAVATGKSHFLKPLRTLERLVLMCTGETHESLARSMISSVVSGRGKSQE